MDLSNEKGLTWLAGLAEDLRAAAPAHEPLIVGAAARDLLLHYGLGVPIGRTTADVDLAFGVRDWEEFGALREALLASSRFASLERSEHRLVHRAAMPVDLVPFNGVERPDGTIHWPADDSVMGVLGYREAWTSSIKVVLPNEQMLLCVSLPMLALLKLLAWKDRHTRAPRKDSSDFFLILINYLAGENADRLYTEAPHLLEEDDFDYELAGAWLAGHDGGRSIIENAEYPERLLQTVDGILDSETNPDGRLQLIAEGNLEAHRSLRLAEHFQEGLNYAGGSRST